MLELYHFYGATCGLKARLAVAEKGIDVKDRAIDRAYLKTPAYLALNPNGVVPTLVHDGQVLTESTVIINYLDEIHADNPLKTDTKIGAARALWWMKRADDTLLSVGNVTYTVAMRPDVMAKGQDGLRAYLDAIPSVVVRERRRRIFELGFENPDFVAALEAIGAMLSGIESALSSSPWLAGDSYSLGDVAVTPLMERLKELSFTGLWDKHPRVSDWWARICDRPSYDSCVLQHPNPEAVHHQYGERGREAWAQVSRAL